MRTDQVNLLSYMFSWRVELKFYNDIIKFNQKNLLLVNSSYQHKVMPEDKHHPSIPDNIVYSQFPGHITDFH